MYFKASKDTSITMVTLAVAVLLGFIIYKNVGEILAQPDDLKALLIHGGSIFLVIFFFVLTYLFAPKGYSITSHGLIVNRVIANKEILFSEIKGVRIANELELRRPIRTFGVGGLFGNYGKFYTKGLGGFTMYGSQKGNYVIITTTKKTIVITPDDLAFVNELKSAIGK